MTRSSESVFIDTGAWIALAIVRDPLHTRARPAWEALERRRARLVTSVPVVLETFTYLDRKGSRELALTWRGALDAARGSKCCPARRQTWTAPWLGLTGGTYIA